MITIGDKEIEAEEKEFTIRLTSEMLGTVAKNKDVYKNHIQAKARKMIEDGTLENVSEEDLDSELETIEEVEEKGWTGFHSDENGIFIYSYMIKGQIKSALEVCMETGAVNKIKAYKKWCDLLLFVTPERLYFGLEKPDGVLERPIRAMTPQGPRVSVVRSDRVDIGRELTFKVTILPNSKGLNMKSVEQALDYGKFVGLGSWRGSGGKGAFEIISIRKVK